jgi:L-2,4-diaminobutyrate decarboxylase
MSSAKNIHEALLSDESGETGAQFLGIAARYFSRSRLGQGQVSTQLSPAEIAVRFAGPMPAEGSSVAEIVERLERDVLADANKFCHPMYMGHQVCAPLPAAVWTESIISALNQSLAIFEMSPTATMIEHQVVRWMSDLVGYPAGSGGTLTSGGTEATFTALLAARNAALPESWDDGVDDDAGYVIYGEHAHYAVTRAIGQLGLGRKRGIPIRSKNFRMDVSHLAEVLTRLASERKKIVAVVATAGSTATGSFDDIEAVADLCDEHGAWLHVDGAHGASALLSRNPPKATQALKRARSLAWDPHKMMLMPLSAGMLLVRDEHDLERAFTQQAPYLFKAEEGERNPDQGFRSFQCSRRADVLKLWVALHRYGSRGIGELYDGLCARTRELHAMIDAHADFETIHVPESNILCFRYRGSDELNRQLRPSFNKNGSGWITSTVLDGRPVLRVTMMNTRTAAEHLTALLEGLSAEARKLGG